LAGQAHLILPTTSYIEKTVFFKNLLGVVQTSSGAVIYSKYPKTNVEIFLDILLYTGSAFLKNFFYFNFKRAVVYNFSLDVCAEALNTVPRSTLLPRNVNSYYYVSTYWAYFSYNFDTKNFKSTDVVNFFLNFFGHVSGSRLYCKPLASSLVNYYSDPALVALSASKTMNTCSSLFLKKNLTLLQLHL
jgi:anaerobic selenocysteine-containing dehydrogenase